MPPPPPPRMRISFKLPLLRPFDTVYTYRHFLRVFNRGQIGSMETLLYLSEASWRIKISRFMWVEWLRGEVFLRLLELSRRQGMKRGMQKMWINKLVKCGVKLEVQV